MIFDFDTRHGFSYHWCGKFTSPNKDWIHMTRNREDYELMLVTDGTLYLGDHAEEYAVPKGAYLLMPPTPYQHGTKSADCSFYWLHFGYHSEQQDHATLPGFTQATSEHLQLPATGFLHFPERLLILMKQLQDSDKRYKSNVLNDYLCGAILAELDAQCRHSSKKESRPKEQLYHDILDYISWHAQENLRIPEIAAFFGYNEKYFSTLFKRHAGITLKQHILQTKMDLAKYALSESNQPISQIAYSLGFTDAHNFSNAFRAVTGLSPSAYREGYDKHNIFQK